ncbi:D-cysteine desulfhydrase 2 [Abeliophyllum distichum]|uniref:D-cysteine desulfhydrase 2 n=1 Tax=Abeliophyllum distichum TaxID=126358 RepID=A0ABD1R8V6_9LAMI
MRLQFQLLPRNTVISVVKREFLSGCSPNAAQGVFNCNLSNDEFVFKLLDRSWALSRPEAKIHQIMIFDRREGGLYGNISFRNNTRPHLGEGTVEKNQHLPSFYIVRDDLLHPLVNGNKARKLDALLPLLQDNFVTDVVTCGGCQSAHAAAVAVSCAERGLRSHLLLRGEEPESLTGYNLISSLYGNVIYVPRSQYAKREVMLATHAESVAGSCGSVEGLSDYLEALFAKRAFGKQNFLQEDTVKFSDRKVVIVNEGVMRLVQYLSQNHVFGRKQAIKIVVDSGTGTTAVGLGLGALCLGLPWKITAVMLADKIDGYKKAEERLISEFVRSCNSPHLSAILSKVNDGVVHWVERSIPRKFGNILEGEVQECQKIAQQTGILLDPIYTLAAWNLATQLSQDASEDAKVVMLHTGGTLGMFGLAQRYKSYFQTLKGGVSSHL